MKWLPACITGMMIIFLSCHSDKEDVISFSQSFFSSLTDSAYGKPADYYPGYDSLGIEAHSDIVDFEEQDFFEKNDSFTIYCNNNFTDKTGNFKQKEVELYLTRDANNHLFIYKSKGLADIDEEIRWYAEATGALSAPLPDDHELVQRIDKARTMLFSEYLDTRVQLREKVKLLNWTWETSDYSGEAHGEGRIVNNMGISIPDVKYHIIYYDRQGDFMAEDEGAIHKTLYPGEKYHFTFWSSNAKYPNTARMELTFSDKLVFDIIRNQRYTGKEYNDFCNRY